MQIYIMLCEIYFCRVCLYLYKNDVKYDKNILGNRVEMMKQEDDVKVIYRILLIGVKFGDYCNKGLLKVYYYIENG